MFVDEARLTARVQHPNVVSIIDVVSEAGELFIVLELVRGESLAQLLKARRADPVPLGLGRRAARLIEYAGGTRSPDRAPAVSGSPTRAC